MWNRSLAQAFVAGCLAVSGLAHGQLVEVDPDWKESEVPPPPPFKTQKLIPIEMPPAMSLRYGIDPDTVRMTNDGIVRYVMVATSPDGAVNANYEAIRCATAEYRNYARQSGGDKWNAEKDSQWIALERQPRTLHALLLARQGLCNGKAPAASDAASLVRRMKNPPRDSNQ